MEIIISIIIFCVIFYKAGHAAQGTENPGQYHGFNWDAYHYDVKSGMDVMAQIEKQKRGDYWHTEPGNYPIYSDSNYILYENSYYKR